MNGGVAGMRKRAAAHKGADGYTSHNTLYLFELKFVDTHTMLPFCKKAVTGKLPPVYVVSTDKCLPAPKPSRIQGWCTQIQTVAASGAATLYNGPAGGWYKIASVPNKLTAG